MSFHELTRKELQALCKQHGLPANKTNAVMASSLSTFFSEQQTIVEAYAQVGTPCTVTKTRSTHVKELETSLAALILGAAKPSAAKGGLDSLLKKCKDQPRSESVVDDGAEGALFLPKTTPLRRRSRKKSDAVKSAATLPVCDEGADHGAHPDSTEILRLPPEKTSVHGTSTPEPQQLAPSLSTDVLVTDDQDSTENLGLLPGEGNTSSPEPQLGPDGLVRDDRDPPRTRKQEDEGLVVREEVQFSSSTGSETVASSSEDGQTMCNVLTSPLLRLTANVDTLIQRATGMLEKFEQWKVDNPGNFMHRSGQKHLAFDKENLYQQSPCKNVKLRSLQGSQMGAQMDRKEGILKDVRLLNAQT